MSKVKKWNVLNFVEKDFSCEGEVLLSSGNTEYFLNASSSTYKLINKAENEESSQNAASTDISSIFNPESRKYTYRISTA